MISNDQRRFLNKFNLTHSLYFDENFIIDCSKYPIEERDYIKTAINSNDIGQRIKATRKINNQEILHYIALTDYHPKVKIYAIKHLYEEERRVDIVLNVPDNNIMFFSLKGIYKQENLIKILYESRNIIIRRKLIERIRNEEILKDISINDYDPVLRTKASKLIKEKSYKTKVSENDKKTSVCYNLNLSEKSNIRKIICNSPNSFLRRGCIKKLSLEEDFVYVCSNAKYMDMIFVATTKLRTPESFKKVMQKSSNCHVRLTAIRKINDNITLQFYAICDEDEDVRKIANKRLKEIL